MSGIRFLHPVGKSTLRQGITVPVSAQTVWTDRIEKGQSLPVSILYGEQNQVDASLRRINNSLGHLQFRYESRRQEGLRRYLRVS